MAIMFMKESVLGTGSDLCRIIKIFFRKVLTNEKSNVIIQLQTNVHDKKELQRLRETCEEYRMTLKIKRRYSK